MKTIALCFNTPGMENDEWVQPYYGKKYPGAGWMSAINPRPYVTDGKHALEKLNPKDVIVVQEEFNTYGEQLVRLGADPRVIMCLESPIFTPHFYDAVKTDRVEKFKHRLLFIGGTEPLYFPSFDEEDLKTPVPWNERKFMCMVTANKHYSMLPKEWDQSPSFRMAMETQLHDYRYDAIGHFIQKEGFKLYGRGWPEDMASPCDDKLETIKNYKFALCFENGSYEGYTTEKVIDCLVAGVIPVYRGPIWRSGMPPCIAAGVFSSWEELESSLRRIPDYEAQDIISYGQAWLRSEGRRHSNLAFAERILEMCA